MNKVRIYKYLTLHPCIECGESNPILLEFDHRNGTNKVDQVYALARGSWERIRKEILKCDVRCVRCHRLKTSKDENWYARIKEYLSNDLVVPLPGL